MFNVRLVRDPPFAEARMRTWIRSLDVPADDTLEPPSAALLVVPLDVASVVTSVLLDGAFLLATFRPAVVACFACPLGVAGVMPALLARTACVVAISPPILPPLHALGL